MDLQTPLASPPYGYTPIWLRPYELLHVCATRCSTSGCALWHRTALSSLVRRVRASLRQFPQRSPTVHVHATCTCRYSKTPHLPPLLSLAPSAPELLLVLRGRTAGVRALGPRLMRVCAAPSYRDSPPVVVIGSCVLEADNTATTSWSARCLRVFAKRAHAAPTSIAALAEP